MTIYLDKQTYGDYSIMMSQKIIFHGEDIPVGSDADHYVKAAFQAGWATAVGNIAVSKDNAKQVFTETKDFLVSKEWEIQKL